MGIEIYQVVRLVLELYRWTLFARVILSWVPVNPYNPVVRFIHDMTEPVMAPFRRILPPVGGIDFSPILLFAVYSFVMRLILTNLWRLVA